MWPTSDRVKRRRRISLLLVSCTSQNKVVAHSLFIVASVFISQIKDSIRLGELYIIIITIIIIKFYFLYSSFHSSPLLLLSFFERIEA